MLLSLQLGILLGMYVFLLLHSIAHERVRSCLRLFIELAASTLCFERSTLSILRLL